jgi:hypothetical protein
VTTEAPDTEASQVPMPPATIDPPDDCNPLHLMLDIETLDNAPTALVLSAGWAWFNRDKVHSSGSICFDHDLQLDGQDRTVSLDTMRWWHRQRTPMPESKHGFDVRMLAPAMQRTHPYYGTKYPADLGAHLVWANSPSFDCVILRCWAARLRYTLPWKFYQERDFRTYAYLVEQSQSSALAVIPRRAAQHSAEQDARDQAQFMIDNKHLVRF